MTKANEVMDMIYGVIAGKETIPTNEEKLEKLDTESSDILKNEEADIVKPMLEKLENMNIFENNFKVFDKLPKTWNVIYSILNKYYAIRVGI